VNPRKGALLVAAVLATALVLNSDTTASDGLKPPAYGTQGMGRGGAEMAWTGPVAATAMHANPASIVMIPDEQFEFCPIVLNLNATYSDPDNGEVRSTGGKSTFAHFPYANSGYVFDFDKTENERLDDLRELDPFHRKFSEPKNPSDPLFNPLLGQEKVVDKSLPVATNRFPQKVEVVARGESAWITNISVVANYYTKSPERAFSHIVGSSGRRVELTSSSTRAAVFENLSNPLVDAPDEVIVYYQLEVGFKSGSDSVDVRVLLDGRDSGGQVTSLGDVRPEETPVPRLEDKSPRFQHELWGAKKEGETSWFKFAIGEVVLAGAGSEYKIKTEIYPDGTRYFSEFSQIALTPTFALRLFDWLALGISVQLIYGSLNLETPVTTSATIMKGPIFPVQSLDDELGDVFGIPAEFGAAMKYCLDTSSTHDPGKSLTHSQRQGPPSGQDVRFAEVTGTAEVKDAIAFGGGVRFGMLFPISDRFTIGLTYQTPSFMSSYKGKAKIDYNRQIQAFRETTTIGHSDEIMIDVPAPFDLILGDIEAEMRFTFEETWTLGQVHVWGDANNDGALEDLGILNLPSGPIVESLPNEGKKGFVANYDIEVVDFVLPQEIGIGAS